MQEDLFVGRELELQGLDAYLDKALSGQGQLCFVVGQPGSGKTALVRQFADRALTVAPDLLIAAGTCNAQAGIGDPYLPFREALAMIVSDDSDGRTGHRIVQENANRLHTAVVRSAQVLVEVAPELVGVMVPGAKVLGAMGKAFAQKVGWTEQLDVLAKGPNQPAPEATRIWEGFTTFLQRLSSKNPLILFLDDLQWADSASISLLFHLGRNIETSRILVLGAYRPNDVALGRGGQRHPLEPVVAELVRYKGDIVIDLDHITEAVSRQFVNAVLDSDCNHFSTQFRETLFTQTNGHALFTMELIRAMQQRGNLVRGSDGCWMEGSSLNWRDLPDKVEGVIAERIGRLDDELRDLLAAGSVEGERFSAEVVARVEAMPERQAIRELSNELERRHRLVRDLGLLQVGQLQVSVYGFVHNLYQHYLYDNLDQVQRVYLHRGIGEAMEAIFADQTDEMAAQLARHFEEGGLLAKAATYRLQAGIRALRMSAPQEAYDHLTRGLQMIPRLPAGEERMRLELGLQTYLGTTLVLTRGYASPAVEQAFTRARALSMALGDPSGGIPALYGLSAYHLVRAQLKEAYQEGEQLSALAEEAGQTGYWLACQLVLGAAATHMGQLDRARKHLEQVVARYDADRDHNLAYVLGQDPAVGALCYLSFGLWHQGYPEQAGAAMRSALERAEKLDHPYTTGYAVSFAAMLYQMLRQWPECEKTAERAMEIGQRGAYPTWQALGMLSHGLASVQLGREEGLAELKQGLDLWTSAGARLAVPYQHTFLAEAYLAVGRREEGLEAIDASFCCVYDVWWLPEQHRVRAELLLLAPDSEVEAEAALRQALEVARRHGSKALELRAATSLARLLQKLGRAPEGHGLLSATYAAFSEGLETADLREARELLQQVAQTG